MSRIHADLDKCDGIGMCEATADTYFELGDDGFVHVLVDEPAAGDEAMVRSAVAACPVAALRLA